MSGIFILLAVVLGALAAHWLKSVLSEAELISFNTAVRYQMWMGLGAAIMVLVEQIFLNKVTKTAWWVLIGAFLFSGSIYMLTLLPDAHSLRQIVGPITPIGGLILISGWGIFMFRILRQQSVK